jgi:Plastocyanin
MRLSTRSIFPLALVAHAQAAHHTVAVGRGGLKFDPETIEAKVGDTITYTFFARVKSFTEAWPRVSSTLTFCQNHSVVESSFAEPCQPLSGGIFSGFVPTESQDEPSRTTFTIFVDDEKPIWLYCSQTNGNHCQNGMVHAINP